MLNSFARRYVPHLQHASIASSFVHECGWSRTRAHEVSRPHQSARRAAAILSCDLFLKVGRQYRQKDAYQAGRGRQGFHRKLGRFGTSWHSCSSIVCSRDSLQSGSAPLPLQLYNLPANACCVPVLASASLSSAVWWIAAPPLFAHCRCSYHWVTAKDHQAEQLQMHLILQWK